MNPREQYADVLDGLLQAGDGGEPLQARHLPHLGGTRLRIALPGVLASDCFHVADIDFGDGRIRYRYNVEGREAQRGQRPLYMEEAGRYAASQWGASMRQCRPSYIRQTRDVQGRCEWTAFDQQSITVLRTRHTCEFMELARNCIVEYDG